MTKIWVLQHAECETMGIISAALEAKGISAEYVRTFAGEPVPKEIGDRAGLVVMGGPMGVYEQSQYPFLADEIRLIEDTLKKDLPVLGVCLGSQLLAAALGAEVKKGKRKEIGWHEITLSQDAGKDRLWAGITPRFGGFHWHGDVFDLPASAAALASSGLTQCQSFRYGRHAYGLLFHAEVTEEIIRGMIQSFNRELEDEGLDGNEIMNGTALHLGELHKIGKVAFERWAAFLTERLPASLTISSRE